VDQVTVDGQQRQDIAQAAAGTWREMGEDVAGYRGLQHVWNQESVVGFPTPLKARVKECS
jgi:hypothetical protein